MDDSNFDISDAEDLNEELSFTERLAQYYSDFLATDFKKGSLPKRRFQTRDKKGRRAGITLEKFSNFIPTLIKTLDTQFGSNLALKVSPKRYLAQLPSVVLVAIEAEIEKIDFIELENRIKKSVKSFSEAIKQKDIDLEVENQRFMNSLSQSVGVVIGAELTNKLQPVFEKSASNLFDALMAVDDDLSELIVSPLEDILPTVIYNLLSENDVNPLMDALHEIFNPEKIKEDLREYFSSFSAGDLATEIRELFNVEQLEDNLEFYLYLGEVRYNNHEFPMFYIPFKLEFEGAIATLNFEPRLLVNKKAIDYIARVIQELTKTQRASPIENRIIYLNPEDKVSDKANDVLETILRAFQFDGQLSFDGKKARLKNSEVTVTNSLNFALFDKSDESMLTDYEELLQLLGQNSGELFNFINELVDNFLTKNPITITNDVYDAWDETEIPERLVFDTPIPLAEEQRKIIDALNNDGGKFITVEGPPGTGKSHTISAIAFGAILRKQSILVLSDKKEALDVVENKLNQTLAKVRPSDDFVNPILRLGRVGTNFKKIVSNKSIETLRTQHREIKKEQVTRERLYNTVKRELKTNIKVKSEKGKLVKLDEIFEYEREAADFCSEWIDEFENFEEIFNSAEKEYFDEISAIKLLLEIRNTLKEYSTEFSELASEFGDDAESIYTCMNFINLVRELSAKTGIFQKAPKINYEKVEAIKKKISEVKASKGVFGYLFAGNKLEQIKSEILALVGFLPKSSKGDEIIKELTEVTGKASEFYDELLKFYDHDFLGLIEDVWRIPSDELFGDDLIEKCLSLQTKIDEEILPFLDDEEPILNILIDEDNGDASFYEEFLELRNAREKIQKNLKFPTYNYLGKKSEIENYNALELASEIDSRVIEFADNNKNDAKTLAAIISQKKRFPRDKFDLLKTAFPCMICSLRDYAEYIPLERELFDIIIIDEASQVSIAQAFPAIIRAKKMIVLGDRKQFGNVKTSNASKEMNNAYFNKVKEALKLEKGEISSDLEIRADKLNIGNSILEFMESLSNFEIGLKKHFRGYPEMISFSSQFFYGNSLQPMKIRGKPIQDVLEFVELEHDGKLDLHKNTNEQEIEEILNRVLNQLDNSDLRSVAVITPFTEQQTLISKIFSDHDRYQEILEKLHFRSFTFDSCQGEERDIIYYSFVATPEKDRLSFVLPISMNKQDEEELDRNKKLQRMNVAFSRGKEKLVFVHSKPISDFYAGKEALNHYKSVLARAQEPPKSDSVDPNSEAEKRVLEWLQQTPVYSKHQPEIQTQFEIGKYLSSLDQNYSHPMYRVDFLLRFNIDGKQRDIIVEYDGFEFHFSKTSEIDAGNWRHYLSENDVEREHILESYGYKTIRLNKFNIGKDPVYVIDELIEEVLEFYEDAGDALIKKVLEDTEQAYQGLQDGSFKVCKKCNQNKPKSEFENPDTMSGYGRFCLDCNGGNIKKKKKKKRAKGKAGFKKCPNCEKTFPETEFLDRSNASGKRRLCGSCKIESDKRRKENSERYLRRMGRWR